MSRSLVLSNGQLAVTLDHSGCVRDVYFPHVGLENHGGGECVHRIGVWCEGVFCWLSDSAWNVTVAIEKNALVSEIIARHESLGVELTFTDTVCHDRNVLLRRIAVRNHKNYARETRIFFGHEFDMRAAHGAGTACVDLEAHAIVHYAGDRVFLMGATIEGESFTDYTTGRAHFGTMEGSFRDAEDGVLSKNTIEHGPADSVVTLAAQVQPGRDSIVEYWLVASHSVRDALQEHAYISRKAHAPLLNDTKKLWHTWVESCTQNLSELSPNERTFYAQSLMCIRAHADDNGGIVTTLEGARDPRVDSSTFVTPRIASLAALALDRAGDTVVTERFFDFCKRVIEPGGYVLHRYLPDDSRGSSWLPHAAGGNAQLPIQEDATAILLTSLAEYVARHKETHVLKRVYESLVERPADFLVEYRSETKLPRASYDIWERSWGVHTYTACAVHGALKSAAFLAQEVGREAKAAHYTKAADEVREAILKHLWDQETGMFKARLTEKNANVEADMSSVYGVYLYGVLPPLDVRLQRAFEETVRRLSVQTPIGGIMRFEGDDHHRVSQTSNPWFVTTLWYAEYIVATATKQEELSHARDILTWCMQHAPSGALGESLDPHTGGTIGHAPHVWSHTEFVRVAHALAQRTRECARVK